jgi:hypothetical protein
MMVQNSVPAGPTAGSEAGGGAQQPDAGGAQQVPDNRIPQDSYWKKAKEAGEAHAKSEFEKWMSETFGTTDREAIASQVRVKKPQNDPVDNTLKSELDKIRLENQQLKASIESANLRRSAMDAIQSTQHKLHDPADTLEKILSIYDLKPINGVMVLHHKDSGAPLFIEGKDGTVAALLDAWSKDPKHSWRFASQSQIAKPSGSATAAGLDGNYTYVVKPEDWSRPGFAEAVARSGQKERAFSQQPIDLAAVERYMNKR